MERTPEIELKVISYERFLFNDLFVKDKENVSKVHLEQLDLFDKGITNLILKNKELLSVEQIIESLKAMDMAPSLIYDDNLGKWAVSTYAIRSVFGEQMLDSIDDIEYQFNNFVRIENFSETVRGAIYKYLEEFEDASQNS